MSSLKDPSASSLRDPTIRATTPPSQDQGPSFPRSPSAFDSDPRVSFSKLDNKFILETEDGQEFEYDTGLKRWVQAVDEDLLEQQRQAYKVAGVDEEEPVEAKKSKKRKQYTNGEEEQPQQSKPKKARVNTAVYVTNLPLDTSSDEINDVFSKCGVIAEEIDSGNPRIKMYTDETGGFKGDALVVYFRPESVNLAIQMLDETTLRFGGSGPPMKVQAADFSYKSQQEAPQKSSARDKKKVVRKTQKMNNKLADWDDDDPQTLHETNSRWDKVVILKHMFTLKELEEDPAAILDIKEDIRDECSKLGQVTNVVLFDKEIDGIASVRFAHHESAQACVRVMDGRFFAGTKVEAYIADGSERFKKSNEKKADADGEGNEEDEAQRLDKFGSWLEGQKAEKEQAEKAEVEKGES